MKLKQKKLRFRKKGEYYQSGYYENKRWVNVAHLGTVEKITELVKEAKEIRKNHTNYKITPKS